MNGLVQGKGLLVERVGSRWVGTWEHDSLNGVGIEICSEYSFEGDYVNGMREGFGKCLWVMNGCLAIIERWFQL